MTDFELHPRLVADSHFAAEWPFCRVLLVNDKRYFWLILVPRISSPSGLRVVNTATAVSPLTAEAPEDGELLEFVDLSVQERGVLMEEAGRAGQIIKASGAPKLNFGILGNIVPQLHLHVVGRAPADPAWPGPVWGHSAAAPYDQIERDARLTLVRSR